MAMGTKLLLALSALAAVFLFTAEAPACFSRLLAVGGIQNAYANVHTLQANQIPPIPQSSTEDVPLYLALCHEWLRQDHAKDVFPTYKVLQEDQDICMDWSAPHMSLMDMLSTLIISAHLPDIKYRPSCDRTTKLMDATATTGLNLNFTTIQQVLETAAMQHDPNLLSVDELKQQCRRCLVSYDHEVDTARVKAKGFHHCFAWPEDHSGIRNLDVHKIPHVPYRFPGVAPISTIIIPLRQSLHSSALEWRDSEKPPHEEESGVVYWLDPTTLGLNYEDVLAEIPNIESVTSISILAGPLCISAILPTGQVCYDYGVGLKRYLASQLPRLSIIGYNGEHGVTFRIVTSTATAMSRMILSRILVCPPRSPSCLFPAAAMPMSSKHAAIVLDDPEWMMAVDFFAIAGHHGTTTVKVLDASKIPRTDTASPAGKSSVAPINVATDEEGYPKSSERAETSSDEILAHFAMAPQHLLGLNEAASTDRRGLRNVILDSWMHEADSSNHHRPLSENVLSNARKLNVAQAQTDVTGCSDMSTLHLKHETREQNILWEDYNMQVRYREMVHGAHDPGVKTLPAKPRAYMVFHEVVQEVVTEPPNVKMSIWNDEESFERDFFIDIPSLNVMETYPIVDLPDGDYFTFTNHWPGNYGHFLHDHLPSIAYARHLLPETTKFLLVKSDADRKRIQFIDAKFEEERVVWIDEKVIHRVSAGSMSGMPSPHVRHLIPRFNELRKWVLAKPSFPTDQKTIIYYTRGGKDTYHGRTMDPVHEKLMLEMIKDKMARYGRTEHLVVFDGAEDGQTMSLQHQFDLYRTATTVIGPHGSGLANILWLPGADSCEHRPKVLEFLVQPSMPEIQAGGAYKTYMYLFGFPQWLEYHHLYYTSDSTRESLHIDLQMFSEALDSLFRHEVSNEVSNEVFGQLRGSPYVTV